MDVVQFLKPKYVYMENVLDILKFADATLARYALSRLLAMHYQAKLGIMAAGCYGLPQFRMRVFLLGCNPEEASNHFPCMFFNGNSWGEPIIFLVLDNDFHVALLSYFCSVEITPISSAYS